ncbi:MAG: hypothetical protein M1816_001475 [Peltula sp. TS41687]|nr:MAG: hypothetical protein M1816_001475 [Peltula sp. TS41687]
MECAGSLWESALVIAQRGSHRDAKATFGRFKKQLDEAELTPTLNPLAKGGGKKRKAADQPEESGYLQRKDRTYLGTNDAMESEEDSLGGGHAKRGKKAKSEPKVTRSGDESDCEAAADLGLGGG